MVCSWKTLSNSGCAKGWAAALAASTAPRELHGEIQSGPAWKDGPEVDLQGTVSRAGCPQGWAGWQMLGEAVAERGEKQYKCISIKQPGLCSQ